MRLRALGLGLWALGCSVAAASPKAQSPQPKAISIKDFEFAPAELTVAVGDTVAWTNADAFIHTSTADSGAWSSPELAAGGRFLFVPKRSGHYTYHCAAHPVMRGLVVVRD